MPLTIFNTFTRKLEPFAPAQEGKVTMYVCGPTVYERGHLGHGRSAVAFDLIRRYLLYKKYGVFFVSNYTDIDDKLIARAAALGISVPQLAERIIPLYEEDYAKLNILKPDATPRATEYIPQMILLIRQLEKKGLTYTLPQDGVYFELHRFPSYGQISHQSIEELRAGARVAVDEQKRHPQDFVLWKFKKEGEPFWQSPWGDGRPGWHIECSAMVAHFFGATVDIHGGGQDLIFPHHEDELAQSMAASGKPLARYWLHNGFVQVQEEKMSKSLGNVFQLRDVLQAYHPLAVRFFLLSTHYRAPIHFTPELLEQAKAGVERLWEFEGKLREEKHFPQKKNQAINTLLKKTVIRFEEAMDNDFEIAPALAALFDLTKEGNKLLAEHALTESDCREILFQLQVFDTVLGVLKKEEAIPEEILQLVNERESARREKNFARADELRQSIVLLGWQVDDTTEGAKVKRRY